MLKRIGWLGMAGYLLLAIGCAPSKALRLGDQLMNEENWEDAVFAYQEAVKENPRDLELRKKLGEARSNAAQLHFLKGKEHLKEKKIPMAIEEFQRALTLDPLNAERQSAFAAALRIKDAEERYAVGLKLLKAGKSIEALREFERTLELDPSHLPAQKMVAQLTEEIKEEEISIKRKEPITLRFQDARIKEVFEVIAKTFSINILFDKDVKDDIVTIFLKDASFKEALNMILTTNNLFMKKVSDDTIIVIPKTKPKVDQYQDLLIRTFYLTNAKAKEMVNLLRTMLETKRVFVNEELNAIVIRDSPEKIKLAEKIIEANDRKVAEVMFEVEILEVDKTNSLKYGFKFSPNQITAQITPSPINLEQLTDLGPASYLFTLPSVILDLLKQESDVRILANPRIRVLNNKSAKVNIGDRVPILLTTTITTPSTTTQIAGQTTSTAIEFKDVGIKLTAEPNIHLNNSVTLNLHLEVSSLGELLDLGNGVKQFKFGTRSADTILNIRDGETVIIGGLIQDEERNTVNRVPGLGDIPVLGRLFENKDKGKVKTDVMLTITPHVVRGLETPEEAIRSFWSGTEEAYSTKPLFSDLPTVGPSGPSSTPPEPPPSPGLPQPLTPVPSPPTGTPPSQDRVR